MEAACYLQLAPVHQAAFHSVVWVSIFSIGIPAWDFLFIVGHPFRAGVLKPDGRVSWPEQLQRLWQFSLRKLGKLHKIIQKEKKKREISETCLEIETCFQCKFRRLKCKRTSNYQIMDSLRSEVLSYSWFLHCQVKCLKHCKTTHTQYIYIYLYIVLYIAYIICW